MTIALGAPRPTATTITLTSSDPAVAAVPQSITIAAGQISVTFEITAVSIGTATITATLPSGAKAVFSFNASAVVCGLNAVSPFVGVDGTDIVTLTISQAQSAAFAPTLVSSNPAGGTVPAIVTVAAGSTSASFAVIGGTIGQSTTITVTMPAFMGGSTCSAAVTTASLSAPTLTPTGLLVHAALLALAGAIVTERFGG